MTFRLINAFLQLALKPSPDKALIGLFLQHQYSLEVPPRTTSPYLRVRRPNLSPRARDRVSLPRSHPDNHWQRGGPCRPLLVPNKLSTLAVASR
ncbi:hypothetical protein J6590_004986 [Homalodisca vitripennis]|nr:hypothetical protein J6590_004986 [Homalodisca vitripennis]